MRRVLLACSAVAAWTLSYSAVQAAPFDFSYTGSLITFAVPRTGTYQVLAYGAQGGSFYEGSGGGLGAEIGGDFSLTAGELLEIAVGGAGATGGGGGGGSFVVRPGNTPLVIAGGGGGASQSIFLLDDNGGPGLTGPNGNGLGGQSGSIPVFPFCRGGGGGGGFLGPGGDPGGGGRFPALNGGSGGGGFGGGGGGPGGGGGGYSGGAGGQSLGGVACQYGVAGGQGGGSFDAGANQILTGGVQSGDGEVLISELAVPEPISLALFGIGLAGIVGSRSLRERRAGSRRTGSFSPRCRRAGSE